jgi:mannitol/fructose-specific phosphotransferase system IIA component (Ntr-type)
VLLSELIQEDVIKIGLQAHDKWGAIEELLDVLVATHVVRLTDRAQVLEAVTTREKSLPTGLEHGLAVPHGSVDCVGDIVASLGTSAAGIPFESQDGKPAHLVVLLVIPKGSFPRHVRTLAGIARLALSKELRERIIAARTPREVAEVILGAEAGEETG